MLFRSIGVAEEAANLAGRYGIDENSAYLIGLLHDIAKELPAAEKLRLCEEYGIEIDEIMRQKPDLTHSFLSAEMAKREFNIKNKDMLNAIRYHTTGRPDMSLLEKILYISDCIEPNRPGYQSLLDVRQEACEDIDGALIKSMRSKMAYTRAKNEKMHPLSIEALKYLENRGGY